MYTQNLTVDTLPTERNYAISYWRKIVQYIHYRLEEITPLVSGVKSYSTYITDWKKSIEETKYWGWCEGQMVAYRKHEGYLVNFANRIDSNGRVIEGWSDWKEDLNGKDVRLLAE